MQDLAEVKDILKNDPNNPGALKLVANHYLREGRYGPAKNYFIQSAQLCPHLRSEIMLDYEREIDRLPEVIGPRLSLAGFQLKNGELDAAILELEETLELSSREVEAYNLLGRIYLKLERLDETIILLERSLNEGIKDVNLTEILAGAYLSKGRVKEATRFYEEILSYKPGDKRVLRVLAELYARQEDYLQAAQKYQAMFSDDPEVSREVITRLEELLKKLEGSVTIREILSEIYMRSLNPEAAVGKLREILRLDVTQLEDVIRRYKEILKSYPGHPPTFLALASALRLQGNFSEAVEGYHNLAKSQPEFLKDAMQGYLEVLEYCPDQILARTYLAEAFLYQNQVKEALQEFAAMLRIDPSCADAVIKKCREIRKSQPQLLLAQLVLGRAYLAKDDVQRAVVEAEGVIAIDKKHTAAYLLLGEAFFRMKLCRKAVEILRQALTIDPYNLEVQERYKEAREKEVTKEIEKSKELISQDPWRVSQHLDLAKLYLRQGLREEAVRELQIALKDQVRAPFAANLLGCIYRSEGRYDLAAAQFNKALELAPAELADFARSVRFSLGTTFEAQGLVKKALKIYESILQEDIDFGNLKQKVKQLKACSLKGMRVKSLIAVFGESGPKELVFLWGCEGKNGRSSRKEEMSVSFGQDHNASGFDYYMKGMYKAALEEFQLAVQLDSKFDVALNNLGIAFLKEGRFTEAREKFEEAVQLDPHSAVFRNNLGLAYFLTGQIDKAMAELEKAYTRDPELSAVCLNFGDICVMRKDIRRAIDLYKRAGKFDVLAEITEHRLAYRVP
ncbi:MAG: tetratricopeptide repeat protein [bacterium]